MITSILLAVALVMIVLDWLARESKLFAGAISDLGNREPHIDGLRGLCALLVAAHHLAYYYVWVRTGEWQIRYDDHVLRTMGKVAVAIFFLICAYLFWGKVSLAARNRRTIDFLALLRNRLWRLSPMYAFAMAAAILVVGLGGEGFRLHQSYSQTLEQTVQAFGYCFFGIPIYNGSFLAYAAIGVSWSLRYEWLFYLSLPLLSSFNMPRLWFITLPALIVINECCTQFDYVEYFAYGGIAYELSRLKAVRRALSGRLFDGVSLLGLGWVTWHYNDPDIARGLAPLLLSAAFLPIAAGASWFGALNRNGFRFVGSVSYSLYLLHCVVLFIAQPALRAVGNAALAQLVLNVALLLVIVVLSFVTYATIERPFMAKGSLPARRAPLPGRVVASL